VPVYVDAPQPWKVGPGLKSTLLTNFQDEMGNPNLIPLFTPASPAPNYVAASGTGQNATYDIVGFVGITISEGNGHGESGMEIYIQPMGNIDPTSIIPSPTPAGTTQTQFTTTPTTFISAKLTR
jgi:hypothetical protein